ncbi:Tat pathway signal protein [Campylobacter sp. faydin G-140]|uniref:Tat pathway signal protein n=1 Tax=Campylobacter anatolicus TaxID=2829105 RepID=UPI001B8FF707|nr:Tat pathway signal protein [Campylobacter anatolicus]MBR8465296.1 Tat pathway signal protein [Campylobacter anatolicus]
MKKDRREFLKKSLKVGAITGAVTATTLGASGLNTINEVDINGVVVGKSNKKEVLYHKTISWEQYYKVAY